MRFLSIFTFLLIFSNLIFASRLNFCSQVFKDFQSKSVNLWNRYYKTSSELENMLIPLKGERERIIYNIRILRSNLLERSNNPGSSTDFTNENLLILNPSDELVSISLDLSLYNLYGEMKSFKKGDLVILRDKHVVGFVRNNTNNVIYYE